MGMGFHPVERRRAISRRPKQRDDAAEEPLIPHRRRRRQRPGAAAPFRVRAHNPGIRPEIAGKLGIHGGLDVLRQTTDGASS
jgi:hypothetical protein